MAIETGGMMVTTAESDLVGSAVRIAVTVTVGVCGAVAGAVYKPVDEIVPQVAPVHDGPSKRQVMAWLRLLTTVAVNCC